LLDTKKIIKKKQWWQDGDGGGSHEVIVMVVIKNIADAVEITGWYYKWIIICRIFHKTSWVEKYFLNK